MFLVLLFVVWTQYVFLLDLKKYIVYIQKKRSRERGRKRKIAEYVNSNFPTEKINYKNCTFPQNCLQILFCVWNIYLCIKYGSWVYWNQKIGHKCINSTQQASWNSLFSIKKWLRGLEIYYMLILVPCLISDRGPVLSGLTALTWFQSVCYCISMVTWVWG